MPITTEIDAGEQLSEMDVKITGQRARHMTLKQQHEACASDPKGDEDGDHAAGHQTKPQRRPSHGCVSGTEYPNPRRVSMISCPSFLRTRRTSTSSAFESCSCPSP